MIRRVGKLSHHFINLISRSIVSIDNRAKPSIVGNDQGFTGVIDYYKKIKIIIYLLII